MKTKKWILFWLLSISSLVLIGVFNYIIDPYQQYRKATFYKLPYENEKELNAGLAKNFEYDSVVLGTSMMQNFNITDLHNLLGFEKPIKLTMAGSSAYEQNIIFSTALRHQTIKNVLIGIDYLSYYGEIQRYKHGSSSFPTYLYDGSLLNDYKYLVSSDTLGRSFEVLFNSKKDNWVYDYTKMYEWKSRTQDKNLLTAIKKKWQERENFDRDAKEDEKKLVFLKKNFDYNIKPFIQNNKSIEFILFFPPYSILAYKIYEDRGQLNDFIKFKQYILNGLADFPNVKIYDFQFADEITFDLHKYYDLYHYNKDVSLWMLEQIKNGTFKVDSKFEKESSIQFLKKISEYNEIGRASCRERV